MDLGIGPGLAGTMKQKPEKALVPRPPSAVEKVAPGAKRILSGMMADCTSTARTLASREQRAPISTRFRIGEYEWCEPDYQQILIWAVETGLKPEEVVTRLLDQQPSFYPFFDGPPFANGRLLKVNFDLRLLRCGRLEWVNGLEITHLHFIGASGEVPLSDLGMLPLARLVWLSCSELGLTRLNLTKVPKLEYLDCLGNRLAELQLHCVPQLTSLLCSENELAELKLNQTSNLHFLSCGQNRLTQLDLSGLHRLKAVFCGKNKLTELKLTDLPTLASLHCEENSIHELDLAEVPELHSLDCSRNQISKLDLNQCPKLRSLLCYRNRLTWLDLSSVQELKYLDCADNAIEKILMDLEQIGQKHIIQDLWSHWRNEPGEREPRVQEIIDRFHAGEGGPTERVRFGLACLHGRDTSKDPIEAYKWFKLAAEQGDKDAAEELAYLASILPSVWLQEGDRRYREFKAAH